MKFKDLDEQTKEYLNTTLIDFANSLGGINFFFTTNRRYKKRERKSIIK